MNIMLSGLKLFPWNYTLPDLKDYMNSSDLPSAHVLLGLTTTTTEVSNVNKPIFPLNLTLWGSVNMPWRSNSSTGGREDSGSSSRQSSSYNEARSRSHYSSSPAYDQIHSLDDARRGSVFSHDSVEGVAQMVIPASLGTMTQEASFVSTTFNSSLLNDDHYWVLFDNKSVSNSSDLEGSGDEASNAMSTAGMVVTSVILGVMILTTVIGNVFVIAAILLERNLQQVANFLIVSLAVADLMVACLVMPLGAVYEISREWVLGPELCDMWTSSDVLCCTASILHLVAIALDRYWAITHVDYIQTRRNGKRIGTMILFVWMTAVIVSMAPFFGWKDKDYLLRVNEQKKCLVSQDLGYQIFATLATFYVPLTVILILYWRIFQTARKRLHKRPGKSKAAKRLSFRSKSNEKKVEATTSRSNGVSQQKIEVPQTYDLSTQVESAECCSREYLETFDDDVELKDDDLADMPQPAGLAFISGNQVIIQHTPMFLRGHRNSVAVMGPYGSVRDPSEIMHCMSLMQTRENPTLNNPRERDDRLRFVKTGSMGPYAIGTMGVRDRFSLDGNLELSSAQEVDLQCRALLNNQEFLSSASTPRTQTNICQQVDAAVITDDVNAQYLETVYQPKSFQKEHTALYKHESTNTSTRSLFKNESTNTDSVYDFPLSTSYDNLSPTYTRKALNETEICSSYFTTEDSCGTNPVLAIEPAAISSEEMVRSAADKLKLGDGIARPITSSVGSDCQLPCKFRNNKESSSLIPSASSSQEVEVSSKSDAHVAKDLEPPTKHASNISLTKENDSVPSSHNKKSKKESLDAKREKKAAKTLAIITGAFVVCWLPFFAIALLMPVCPSCWMSDVMFSFFLWLGYFNSTLNPIIYTIFSPEFREAFKRILCGRKNQRYRPGKWH
ncbi:G protein-coupled receptor rhodopsin-like [Trinorchestia longiramus]|nr:G protein-coupled receptor rhodopsin-like [Trinorchestia longiramus]